MADEEEKTPKFLVKLLKILRSKEYAKILGWVAHERGIKIHNQKRLEDEILPRYFRHGKMSSFVRQLNMYDFHKIYLDENTSVFFHQKFNPRKKESIYSIKRKNTAQCEEKSGSSVFTDSAWKKNKENQEEKPVQKMRVEKKVERRDSICSQKRSSFKLLFKNSFGNLGNMQSVREQEQSTEQILDEIITQIAPLKLSEESIREKIEELRKHRKFRRQLKKRSFLCKIYAKLGIQMSRDEDKLSQLSIEDELLYRNTKKEISFASLKMFESRPIYLRDTIGMFLN